MNKTITVEVVVKADIGTVWNSWNAPEHIVNWCHASDDWECTAATNDLRVGGSFSSTLAAKDKSTSFEFGGVYSVVEPNKLLAFTLGDGRAVTVSFAETEDGVRVVENFEMENQNSEEKQRSGWQAIMDNFKSYTETVSE